MLAVVPLFARSSAETLSCSASVTRVMIFAIAALALDLLVGYGALVSFGHAAFIGLGAYAVGILVGARHHRRADLAAGRARRLGAVRAR